MRRLIAAADATKKDDVSGAHVRMLAAMAKDRLGGSLEGATPAAWPLVHSPLMEFEELQLEAQGRPARLRASGFVRLAYNDNIDGSTQILSRVSSRRVLRRETMAADPVIAWV